MAQSPPPFHDGHRTLEERLVSTASMLGDSNLLKTESYDPAESEIEKLVAMSLAQTDHMEAALATTGPLLASLQRDIIPELKANSARLENLYAALDAMQERVIPKVETSLKYMEIAMDKLEKEHKSLDPSSITRMLSYFGSSSSTPQVPREQFEPPNVFSTENLMMEIVPKRNDNDGSGGREAGLAGSTHLASSSGVSLAEEGITGVGYEIAQSVAEKVEPRQMESKTAGVDPREVDSDDDSDI
mmetsp:Transcript_7006/g.13010  ORF Transcript_7006/g.13010 Transcript_7006/m.13010 type:complete len:244 (+) Transcript_7006:97-828(+)